LGFINPISVAWALVPFSFIVDWFVNVQQVLEQFTDFAGLTLSNPATTAFYELDYAYDRTDIYHPGGYTYKSWEMVRTQGLSGPVLHLRPWKGLSPYRGATAIALLLGVLKPYSLSQRSFR
jgi:hypothetical protein